MKAQPQLLQWSVAPHAAYAAAVAYGAARGLCCRSGLGCRMRSGWGRPKLCAGTLLVELALFVRENVTVKNVLVNSLQRDAVRRVFERVCAQAWKLVRAGGHGLPRAARARAPPCPAVTAWVPAPAQAWP